MVAKSGLKAPRMVERSDWSAATTAVEMAVTMAEMMAELTDWSAV